MSRGTLARAVGGLMSVAGLALGCTDSTAPPGTPLPVLPTKLAFIEQPAGATAGVVISPQVDVALEDAAGNTVISAVNSVTLTIQANAAGATLVGTTTAPAVDGVAHFADLRIAKARTGYTLKASAANLTSATSTPFEITAGPAAKLLFTTQPSNTMGGDSITPPVEVAAQDSVGNRVAGFADSVTVAPGGIPAPGTLLGQTTVKADHGVATFSNLSIAQVGTGYTLIASGTGLGARTSAAFSILKPVAVVRVTAATTGSGLDPDGYTVCIDPASDSHGGTTCAYGGPFALAVNATGMLVADTGTHSVQLNGVAANCVVVGGNRLTIQAPRRDTTTASFAVACSPPMLHVTTTTSGVSRPAYTYTVCIDEGYYGCSIATPIEPNGAATVPVEPGPHVVALVGVPLNCSVGDNPRTIDPGPATGVAFVITCVAAGTIRITTTTSGVDLDPSYDICIASAAGVCDLQGFTYSNSAIDFTGVSAGHQTVSLSAIAPNCTVAGSPSRVVTVPQDARVDVAFDIACVVAERLAFSQGGRIMLGRTDVTDYHDITPGFAPTWSPDGARLAYQCAQDICAINADSTNFAQLTTDAATNRDPAWSPDGSRIAFAARLAGVTELYVMAANGSGVTRLTQGVGFVGEAAWAPDGTKIVFDCEVDAGNTDLCSVNAEGTGFARLTNDPARDYGAAWRPDGTALAFATTRYGADQIVLMSPGGGSVIPINGLLGFAPTWSPDGTQLALVAQYLDSYGIPYTYIEVAGADGSNAHAVATGYEPAWRPHP